MDTSESSLVYEVARLVKSPGNRQCADCHAPLLTLHAVFANLEYGVWICSDCAEIHTDLFLALGGGKSHNRHRGPHHISASSVPRRASAPWNDSELACMQQAHSNVLVNQHLERYLPDQSVWPRITPQSTPRQRRHWIHAKYHAHYFTLPQSRISAQDDDVSRNPLALLTSSVAKAGNTTNDRDARIEQTTHLPIRLLDYFVVLGNQAEKVKVVLPAKKSGSPRQKPAFTSLEELRFQVEILDCYPEINTYTDTPLPELLGGMVFAQGLTLSTVEHAPQIITYVLTDINRIKLYATALVVYELVTPHQLQQIVDQCQVSGGNIGTEGNHTSSLLSAQLLHLISSGTTLLYMPKALTLLSHYPFYALHSHALRQLYHASLTPPPTLPSQTSGTPIASSATVTGSPASLSSAALSSMTGTGSSPSSITAPTDSRLPLERYLANLLQETALPPRGRCQVILRLPGMLLGLARPPPNNFPLVDFSYRPLFAALSLPHIVQIFACLCHELPVCICAENLSLLTPVQEALLSLLCPFVWQGCYVPVLPAGLYELLDAPVPLLVGVHASYLHMHPPQTRPGSVLYVDLDHDTLEYGARDEGFGWAADIDADTSTDSSAHNNSTANAARDPTKWPQLPRSLQQKLMAQLQEHVASTVYIPVSERNKSTSAWSTVGLAYPHNEHLSPLTEVTNDDVALQIGKVRASIVGDKVLPRPDTACTMIYADATFHDRAQTGGIDQDDLLDPVTSNHIPARFNARGVRDAFFRVFVAAFADYQNYFRAIVHGTNNNTTGGSDHVARQESVGSLVDMNQSFLSTTSSASVAGVKGKRKTLAQQLFGGGKSSHTQQSSALGTGNAPSARLESLEYHGNSVDSVNSHHAALMAAVDSNTHAAQAGVEYVFDSAAFAVHLLKKSSSSSSANGADNDYESIVSGYDNSATNANSNPNTSHHFLVKMLASQMFATFINEKIEALTAEANANHTNNNNNNSSNAVLAPEIRFFDESIVAKRNRSKLTLKKTATPFLQDVSQEVREIYVVPPPNAQQVPLDFYLRHHTNAGGHHHHHANHGTPRANAGVSTSSEGTFPRLRRAWMLSPAAIRNPPRLVPQLGGGDHDLRRRRDDSHQLLLARLLARSSSASNATAESHTLEITAESSQKGSGHGGATWRDLLPSVVTATSNGPLGGSNSGKRSVSIANAPATTTTGTKDEDKYADQANEDLLCDLFRTAQQRYERTVHALSTFQTHFLGRFEPFGPAHVALSPSSTRPHSNGPGSLSRQHSNSSTATYHKSIHTHNSHNNRWSVQNKATFHKLPAHVHYGRFDTRRYTYWRYLARVRASVRKIVRWYRVRKVHRGLWRARVASKVLLLQRTLRRYVAQARYWRMQRAAWQLHSLARMFVQRRRYLRNKLRWTRFQAVIRGAALRRRHVVSLGNVWQRLRQHCLRLWTLEYTSLRYRSCFWRFVGPTPPSALPVSTAGGTNSTVTTTNGTNASNRGRKKNSGETHPTSLHIALYLEEVQRLHQSLGLSTSSTTTPMSPTNAVINGVPILYSGRLITQVLAQITQIESQTQMSSLWAQLGTWAQQAGSGSSASASATGIITWKQLGEELLPTLLQEYHRSRALSSSSSSQVVSKFTRLAMQETAERDRIYTMMKLLEDHEATTSSTGGEHFSSLFALFAIEKRHKRKRKLAHYVWLACDEQHANVSAEVVLSILPQIDGQNGPNVAGSNGGGNGSSEEWYQRKVQQRVRRHCVETVAACLTSLQKQQRKQVEQQKHLRHAQLQQRA